MIFATAQIQLRFRRLEEFLREIWARCYLSMELWIQGSRTWLVFSLPELSLPYPNWNLLCRPLWPRLCGTSLVGICFRHVFKGIALWPCIFFPERLDVAELLLAELLLADMLMRPARVQE